MLVSIIIPTHNSEKYVFETIISVLNQSYKTFEVIVVDDCSADNTINEIKKIQEKDKRIKLFSLYSKKNIKASGSGSKARNYGIKKSKGDLIAFIDSDDLWEKDKLKLQVKSFSKNKLISFTSCRYIENNKVIAENYIKRKFIKFSLNNLPHGLFLYNPIRLSSVLIRRSIFKEINFNEEHEIKAIEDIELWLDFFFKFKKKAFVHIDHYLVTIRRHKTNLSKNYTSNVIKAIYSRSRFMIRNEKYKNLRFFISGIFFTGIQLFIKKYRQQIKSKIIKFAVSLLLIIFITFKSPLFWFLGNKLVYENEIVQTEAAIVFSGHGNINYENKTYQNRYLDSKKLLEESLINEVYLLGREQTIPENQIISALLFNDGFLKKQIFAIETYKKNTKDNIIFAGELIKNKGYKKVIFVTDPYHSFRSKLIWDKYIPDIQVTFNTASDRPNKDKIVWSSSWDHVRVVLYEYSAIVYNYLRGWI